MCNGRYSVTVRTLHGSFSVLVPRLITDDGTLALLPVKVSAGLRQFCLLWATRLAYDQVSALTGYLCGAHRRVSGDSIHDWVQKEGLRLDQVQEQQIQTMQALSRADLPEPLYLPTCSDIDLYDPESVEYVVLTDGIPVKAQKPTRQRQCEKEAAKACQARSEKTFQTDKRTCRLHETDVWVLARHDGTEAVLCDGVSGRWSVVEAVRTCLRQEWSGASLSVVAVTDGAKKIRADLGSLFGDRVRIVLDWYHLQHRVYQLLSGVAHSSSEREIWEEQVLSWLWHGKVGEAVSFLRGLPSSSIRREKDWAALLFYLEKHAGEIVDYQRRQLAGKVIGSGRMEKCVDQVVGRRQKEKGMSWSKAGSRSLAMVTAAQLTAQQHPSKYGYSGSFA